jgi:RNA polymerase sigma-70 factor, ECF subfamily
MEQVLRASPSGTPRRPFPVRRRFEVAREADRLTPLHPGALPSRAVGLTVTIDDFRKLLLESLPRLHRFARAYCGNKSDADDAVQSACEHALVKWRQWTGQGAFEHWLTKILVNSWRDERRSRRVRSGPDFDSILDLQDAAPSQNDSLYFEQVRGEIQKLPEGQREVLVLVAAEGFSYQEVANLLGVPIGTVMSRLCRARQKLIAKFSHGND